MEKAKITFEVREERGQWSVYQVATMADGSVREIFGGSAPVKWAAEEMKRRSERIFAQKSAHVSDVLTKRAVKISTPKKRTLETVAMALDSWRASGFYELLTMLNIMIHCTAYTYDELSDDFSSLVDPKTKNIFTNMEKDAMKMLNSTLASTMSGGNDEFVGMAQNAMRWMEILKPLFAYVKPDETDWRWLELQKTLANILPAEALEQKREEIYQQIRASITLDQDDKILERGGE